jgi:hypothetical protein
MRPSKSTYMKSLLVQYVVIQATTIRRQRINSAGLLPSLFPEPTGPHQSPAIYVALRENKFDMPCRLR